MALLHPSRARLTDHFSSASSKVFAASIPALSAALSASATSATRTRIWGVCCLWLWLLLVFLAFLRRFARLCRQTLVCCFGFIGPTRFDGLLQSVQRGFRLICGFPNRRRFK